MTHNQFSYSILNISCVSKGVINKRNKLNWIFMIYFKYCVNLSLCIKRMYTGNVKANLNIIEGQNNKNTFSFKSLVKYLYKYKINCS